jgi:hypothetical protein
MDKSWQQPMAEIDGIHDQNQAFLEQPNQSKRTDFNKYIILITLVCMPQTIAFVLFEKNGRFKLSSSIPFCILFTAPLTVATTSDSYNKKRNSNQLQTIKIRTKDDCRSALLGFALGCYTKMN